jgi:hypothetical protein
MAEHNITLAERDRPDIVWAAIMGTTTETELAGVDVDAGSMGDDGWLVVHTEWSWEKASTKNLRIRFGDHAVELPLVNRREGRVRFSVYIHNHDFDRQVVNEFWNIFLPRIPGDDRRMGKPAFVDTSQKQRIRITAELSDIYDMLRLDAFTIQLRTRVEWAIQKRLRNEHETTEAREGALVKPSMDRHRQRGEAEFVDQPGATGAQPPTSYLSRIQRAIFRAHKGWFAGGRNRSN